MRHANEMEFCLHMPDIFYTQWEKSPKNSLKECIVKNTLLQIVFGYFAHCVNI